MNRPFLILFAVTITLAVLALPAGRFAASGGSALAGVAFLALALPAAIGLAALVRITYLDGAASRRAREGGRAR